MGPDKFSSLTTTSYYVKSVATGKFFYTDDVVQPPVDLPTDLQLDDTPIYLEERGNQPAPVPWPGVPTRRLRGKTIVPAISMASIEGEDKEFLGFDVSKVSNEPRIASMMGSIRKETHHVPEWLCKFVELESVDGSDEESWSMATDSDETSASSQDRTPSMQSDVEELGGGEREEAPNNRAGGSYPVASKMSGPTALRYLHNNLVEYTRASMRSWTRLLRNSSSGLEHSPMQFN